MRNAAPMGTRAFESHVQSNVLCMYLFIFYLKTKKSGVVEFLSGQKKSRSEQAMRSMHVPRGSRQGQTKVHDVYKDVLK